MSITSTDLQMVDPKRINRNPNNPRRYFNDERLDLLRTSIQETGILVPLIAYRDVDPADYILMDGERRWLAALELGLQEVPVNVISAPDPLDNLLQMFNIHAVREEWPLVSIALSLREVMKVSGETRESRLAVMTGLTRSTVRRSKRLLSLPDEELELIKSEAHLDRSVQIHREDLYLEIEAAESVIRNEFPEIGDRYSRDQVIRQFARKRELGSLQAVTDFRDVGKMVKAAESDLVDRSLVLRAVERLIDDESLSPTDVFNQVARQSYEQQELTRRIAILRDHLVETPIETALSDELREALRGLRAIIDEFLGSEE